MGESTVEHQPTITDQLVAELVDRAGSRAWLHDDPASFRAGVAALRRELERARDTGRPVDDALAARAS